MNTPEQNEDTELLWEVLQEVKGKILAYKAEMRRMEVLLKVRNACPSCLTTAWVPADENTPKAIKHPELGWIACQHCQLLDLTTDQILKKHGV